MTKGFLKAGHWPTLLGSFLYFDVSFMVWVLLGPLGPFIAEDLQLNASQKGFLVATPLLAGSFFRPLLGWLADVIGGRRAGLLGLSLSLAPLLIGWRFGTLESLYVAAILLGIAGASFAVALPLASRWYPAEYQGLAMGIAGAGNSGTLLATLFAPRLAQHFGWHAAMGIAAIPVVLVFLLFFLLTKDAPGERKPLTLSAYRKLLSEPDTAWFCLFYSITFGGFVGLASFLSIFFYDQYSLSKIRAGDLTTIVVLCGSFLRPVGGYFADRLGGFRLLLYVLAGASASLLAAAQLPSFPVAVMLFAFTMAMFGIGNGAIFQLVPQRFPRSVGVITGLVGAAGGVGGFFLPSGFGVLKQMTGSFSTGLTCFAMVVMAGCGALLVLRSQWLRAWPEELAVRAGLLSSPEIMVEPARSSGD